MTSKWDFYQCTVNGKPASIYLDLALQGAAPDLTRSLLLIVWLDLRFPDPDHRMSTDAEFDALAAIEDRLADSFKGAYGCTYAGRITTDGRRPYEAAMQEVGNAYKQGSAAGLTIGWGIHLPVRRRERPW